MLDSIEIAAYTGGLNETGLNQRGDGLNMVARGLFILLFIFVLLE